MATLIVNSSNIYCYLFSILNYKTELNRKASKHLFHAWHILSAYILQSVSSSFLSMSNGTKSNHVSDIVTSHISKLFLLKYLPIACLCREAIAHEIRAPDFENTQHAKGNCYLYKMFKFCRIN